MKKYRFLFCLALTLTLAVTATSIARAQDTGTPQVQDTESPFQGSVSGQANTQTTSLNASTDLETTDANESGVRGFPAFSLGARLDLMPAFDLKMALIEADLDLMSRLSIFAAVGFSFMTDRLLTIGDVPIDYKYRTGSLLLDVGARFNIVEPRPGHAHIYAAGDVGYAFGFGTYVQAIDGELVDGALELEDALKDQGDYFVAGLGLGLEYTFVEEFSIAGEVGGRLMVNRVKDCPNLIYTDKGVEPQDVDKAREVLFSTGFALRLIYHF